MSEIYPFTIEQFYKFIGERKLMGVKCNGCGNVFVPPRPACPKCLSTDLSWTPLKNRGKLITYTIIHVAPEKFQHMAPYAFGIIEIEGKVRIPGIIRDVKYEDLKIGMELEVDFEADVSATTWPQWPRYFFKPSQT